MGKHIINALVIGALVCSAASAQTWTSIEPIVPPTETVTSGGSLTSSNYQNTLSKVPKGEWKTYLNKFDSPKLKTDEGDLIISAKRTSGGTYGNSTSYASFGLSDEIFSSEKVRISFDVQYVTPEIAVNVGINVGSWEIVPVIPDFGRSVPVSMANIVDASDIATQFKFGLLNMATNEWYGADILGGDSNYSHVFDWSNDSWFDFICNGNGLMEVSFELDSAQMQTITDAGLAIVIMTNYGSSAESGTDVFIVNNFRTDIVVPEPSTYAFAFGIIAVAFAVLFRRRG